MNINIDDLYKSTDIIIVNPYNGLGNKLRAIASAYSIAKTLKKTLIINWIPSVHCDCTFDDLFVIPDDVLLYNKKLEISEQLFDIYDCVDFKNGTKNKYINTNTKKNIYIKSYEILNNEHANKYVYEFIRSLIPIPKIQKIINSISIPENTIAVHIRTLGGDIENTDDYDKLSNWTPNEQTKLKKYRSMSSVDNFIKCMEDKLKINNKQTFFIATDTKDNYQKIIELFGNETIKYISRNVFDRSLEGICYAVADIWVISKCSIFYSSHWSSFSAIPTYLKKFEQTETSLNFVTKNTDKISVVQTCKNRCDNLIKSIRSYIDSDVVDDIVIVDFNSDICVKKILSNNNITNGKIRIIEVINNVPWIPSWAFNIGFVFAKNNKILKLDADNIINDIDYLDVLNEKDLSNTVYSFDWQNAQDENQKHLNGFFYLTKTTLDTVGYFNQKCILYGWDDSFLKEKIKMNKMNIIDIDKNFIYHLEHSDDTRTQNQQQNGDIYIDFFGFDISNFCDPNIFTLYNMIKSIDDNKKTTKNDVYQLLSIADREANYLKIKIKNKIQYNNNNNYNIFSNKNISMCDDNILKKMI